MLWKQMGYDEKPNLDRVTKKKKKKETGDAVNL